MAVAEMSVMTLIGLERDKSAVLDALQKCACAQLRRVDENQNAPATDRALSTDGITESIDRVERALSLNGFLPEGVILITLKFS